MGLQVYMPPEPETKIIWWRFIMLYLVVLLLIPVWFWLSTHVCHEPPWVAVGSWLALCWSRGPFAWLADRLCEREVKDDEQDETP